MLRNILLVAIGGAGGSVLRYLVGLMIRVNNFPAATFIINIIGCLLIGIVIGFTSKNANDQQQWRLLLATGFCGGFTTFSAFSYESLQLIQEQRWLACFLYISASVIIGITATFAGFWISK
jgi:CrcB protein